MGELQWRTHLARQGGSKIAPPLAVYCDDVPEQLQPRATFRPAKALEGSSRRRDGPIEIRGPSEGDRGACVLGGRIDDVEPVGCDRVDPGTVDIELQVVRHGASPFRLEDDVAAARVQLINPARLAGGSGFRPAQR